MAINKITGKSIKDVDISASDLAPGTITTDKIAPGTIAADRLAGGITNTQLAGSIANAKLAEETKLLDAIQNKTFLEKGKEKVTNP